MLDIQLLRKDLPAVVAGLARRGVAFDEAAFRTLEDERKSLQTRTEELQARRNALSKQVGILKGKGEDASGALAEVGGIGEELKANETALAAVQERQNAFLRMIPNIPRPEVAAGKSERRQRRGAPLGHAARLRLPGEGPRRRGRRARDARLRHGRQALGGPVLGAQGGPRAHAPGARAVHAGRAHARARLHRGLRPLHGDGRVRRRGLEPRQVQGRPLQARGARPLPHPDGGVPGHQLRARHAPRGEGPAPALRLPQPVLPVGGGQLRQGHARHDPPAPVRQGGDPAGGAPRALGRGPRGAHRARGDDPRSAWGCPTAP